jgi:phosphoglycerate dehydrogenase-like enzyme
MYNASMAEMHVLFTVNFPEALLERLKTYSPELVLHVHPTRDFDEIPADLLPSIEILYTFRALPDLEIMPRLRWVQFHSTGVDHAVDHPLFRSDLKVTTLSGAAVPQMAEYAVMGILALGHRLPEMMEDKHDKQWSEDRFERFRPRELRGSVVGIYGYGSVGREIARICKAFGAEVLVSKRDLKHLDDQGYVPEGMGDLTADLPDRIYPPQAIKSMAAECDYLIITVPLTSETRGAIQGDVLEVMKETAFLIDLSRGGIVDHGALVEALTNKAIAGALLDVFPIEPLPETSPLWELPNVILSPHIAGSSAHYYERATEVFGENLRRYLGNEPLLNLYDPAAGY